MRVLVAYETGHGSTAEIAQTIGEVLEQAGLEVVVERCRQVADVSGYDAFVVGAPVWATKWLKPARAFLRENAHLLCERPTAIFITSGAASDGKGKQMAMRSYVPKVLAVAPGLQPVAMGNFAGVISFPKYSLPMRLMMKALCKAQGMPTSGIVDLRDWDEIRTWAKDVYEAFENAPGR